ALSTFAIGIFISSILASHCLRGSRCVDSCATTCATKTTVQPGENGMASLLKIWIVRYQDSEGCRVPKGTVQDAIFERTARTVFDDQIRISLSVCLTARRALLDFVAETHRAGIWGQIGGSIARARTTCPR